MRRLNLIVLCAVLLLPSLALAQLSTRVQREIEACVAAGDSLCSGGGTSISQGGGACTVDANGAIDCTPASGQDFTVTVAGGGEASVTGGFLVVYGNNRFVGAFDGGAGRLIQATNAAQTMEYFGIEATSNYTRINTNTDSELRLATGGINAINIAGTSGNVGILTEAPGGSSTAGTATFSIANGTEPLGAVANQISIYSVDSSDGATNATLGLLTEQAVETATCTINSQLQIVANGTNYNLPLCTIP